MKAVVEAVMTEVRRRTRERFSLPEGETLEVRFVTGQTWGAYNWYLGGYRSRIDVNLDLPIRLYTLPDLLAHEAYPGHHTELVVKELLLCRQEGRDEHTVLLLNAPEAVVREGIAMHARRLVLSDEELRDWLVGDLVGLAGRDPVDVKRMLAVNRAKQVLYQARGNAALLLHGEGASEAEVGAYLQRYSLLKPEEARKALEGLSGSLMRGYIFTYLASEALLDELFARGDANERFATLLAQPASPSGTGEVDATSPAPTVTNLIGMKTYPDRPADELHRTLTPEESWRRLSARRAERAASHKHSSWASSPTSRGTGVFSEPPPGQRVG